MRKRAAAGLLAAVLLIIFLVIQQPWKSWTQAVPANRQAEGNVIDPSSIQAVSYKADSFQKYAEADGLELWVNDAGHLKIRHMDSGKEWNSLPSEAALAAEPKGLWRNHLLSPFLADYVDGSKQNTSVTISTANLDDSKTKVTIRPASAGVEIGYDLRTLGISFNVKAVLAQGHLDITVPAESIKETSSKQVTSLWPYPFLGAVRKQDIQDGYMLVPAEMGALVPMKDEKQLPYRYTALLYGTDRALPDQGTGRSFDAPLPVFGMAHDGQSFLGVIKEGKQRQVFMPLLPACTRRFTGLPRNFTTASRISGKPAG
ncbi:DUF5696 domain-containing protein [Paenibacillus sp. CC-CFT747]|nr:DUF5696 domain-containing protein [Paenibacillus sp. CC-CFT747]